MIPTLALITTELLAALVALYPTQDQVQIGRFDQPIPIPDQPFIGVEPPLTVDLQPLMRERMFRAEASFAIRVWAPLAADQLLGTENSTAMDVARAIKRGIETARRAAAPGTAIAQLASLVVSQVGLGPVAARLPPGWAAALLTVDVRYFTATGV